MKKTLLSAAILLAHFCHGQTSIGIKGGLNSSKFVGSDAVQGASARTGGNFGLYGNGLVAKNISLQIELSASFEGENYNYNTVGGNYTGSFKFTYLNLPVLAHIKLYEGLFAEAGPQIGLLLSATQDNTISGGTSSASTSSDYSSYVKTLDFGLDFGVGYRFSNMFAIGARYNLGISKLGADISYPYFNKADYKNSVFSFNLFVPLTRHTKKNK